MEIPIAIQGLWSPRSLPFLELNNTSVVMLKVRLKSKSFSMTLQLTHKSIVQLYAALSLGSCIAAFLCFSLPGK